MDTINLETLLHVVRGTLRTCGDVATSCGDELHGRIVTDRSAVRPGDVFWALDDRAGSESARAWEAYARGAVGVIATAGRTEPCGDGWLIEVADATVAIEELARWQRSGFRGTVVAVAGEVGKTITSELIETILGRRAPGVVATAGEDRAELSLALLDIVARTDHAVVELTATDATATRRSMRMAAPHIGVVTNAGDDLESTRTLLANLPAEGLAVLNGDDAALRKLADRSRARIVWVGRRPDCDLVATQVRAVGGTLNFTVDDYEICLPVWGRHHLTSALLAIAVGRACGLAMDEIAAALAEFDPPPMRCQVLERGGVRIVNDACHATPTSMRAALEALRDCRPEGRRFVVCGDLDDSGADAESTHRRIGDEVVTLCGADVLVACGAHAAEIVDGARAAGMPARSAQEFREPAEAIASLSATLRAGDVVLWKGSREAGLERLLDGLDSTRPRLRLVA